jgi:hypothetical protein
VGNNRYEVSGLEIGRRVSLNSGRLWVCMPPRAGRLNLIAMAFRTITGRASEHTFASLGRVSGEAAFNVARAMGHSRSTIVDQVYAHSLPSGMASVAERVTTRALGLTPTLRVIEGGHSDARDVDVR